MKPRGLRILGRSLITTGAVLVVLGFAMPAIAMGSIHDATDQAQREVDRAKLNLIIFTVNLGTKVNVYGTVEGLVNATDLDFIPDAFPLRISAMRLTGLDGLVIFDNKLGFVNGEMAVVEGYYVSFSYNNTTYSMISGSSLPGLGFAIAGGFESGALALAKVFRPWWPGTALALEALGGVVVATGAGAEIMARRSRQPTGGTPPSPGSTAPPPPPAP